MCQLIEKGVAGNNDMILNRFFANLLVSLVATILEMDAHSSETKLIAETLLGQLAIFKSSRVTVLHNMGWENYGEKRIADIERIVTFNVNALLHAYQKHAYPEKDIVL